MPQQCSFKNLCFFAPIMPKIMLSGRTFGRLLIVFVWMTYISLSSSFQYDPSGSLLNDISYWQN